MAADVYRMMMGYDLNSGSAWYVGNLPIAARYQVKVTEALRRAINQSREPVKKSAGKSHIDVLPGDMRKWLAEPLEESLDA